MSLEAQLTTLATRAGTENKAIRTLLNGNLVDLSGLNTTAKNNLVAAINEVLVTAGAGGINDAVMALTSTWSSQKVNDEIVLAINNALDGAPDALDTLNELAAAIGDDANFAASVNTALGNRVRFDAAQTLSATQQVQACENIGVGNPEHDFVADFDAALV